MILSTILKLYFGGNFERGWDLHGIMTMVKIADTTNHNLMQFIKPK